jgi:hypothetical protein
MLSINAFANGWAFAKTLVSTFKEATKIKNRHQVVTYLIENQEVLKCKIN